MFTGLIETVGILNKITNGTNAAHLYIKTTYFKNTLQLGESIACNGVCLTVTSFDNQGFTADLLPATLDATQFKTAKIGDMINLERALQAGSRLGGHFVSGHVDCSAKLIRQIQQANALLLSFSCSLDISDRVIHKGSIAINGVSLTLVENTAKEFSVQIIPHTQQATNLDTLKIGNLVNVEFDMFVKSIRKQESKLSLEKMVEMGY